MWNLFCCYSLLSEIAESSQCVELVLLVESLLSELAVSYCVELVLLVERWLSILSVYNLFCW